MLTSKLRLLFLCQILYWSTVIVGVAIASIVGAYLTQNPAFATFPLAILTVGNILTTLPLSLLMQRFGRRFGFSLGAIATILGGLISCWAIYKLNFWLFCFGNMLLGVAQASALYYRLAATDDVKKQHRGRAIALVMSGGIVAALIAPTLAIWSKDFLLPHLYAGSYGLISIFGLSTLLLCYFLPKHTLAPQQKLTQEDAQKVLQENTIINKEPIRPTNVIIKQPMFIMAISNTAISHAVMVLIMISTPLAMLAHNHQVDDATYAIQWHVLGMFIPSFFAGKLIDKFDASNISLLGMVILIISISISTSGVALINFYSGLFLLGIGWNLMYTAGSTMIANSHRAREKGKVQGLAELIVSILAAIAAFSSGVLLHQFGWTEVNLGSVPLLIIAAMITLYCRQKMKSRDEGNNTY
jgi:MFS family permease